MKTNPFLSSSGEINKYRIAIQNLEFETLNLKLLQLQPFNKFINIEIQVDFRQSESSSRLVFLY